MGKINFKYRNGMTAVEWLYNKMYEHKGIITITEYEQAKEMEKQHVIDAYLCGADHVMDVQYNPTSYFNEEQYYNETFKNTKR